MNKKMIKRNAPNEFSDFLAQIKKLKALSREPGTEVANGQSIEPSEKVKNVGRTMTTIGRELDSRPRKLEELGSLQRLLEYRSWTRDKSQLLRDIVLSDEPLVSVDEMLPNKIQ